MAEPLHGNLRPKEWGETDVIKVLEETRTGGEVHCPICTHTVPAALVVAGRKVCVKPGQKCPRCSATLDAAAVVRVLEAA